MLVRYIGRPKNRGLRSSVRISAKALFHRVCGGGGGYPVSLMIWKPVVGPRTFFSPIPSRCYLVCLDRPELGRKQRESSGAGRQAGGRQNSALGAHQVMTWPSMRTCAVLVARFPTTAGCITDSIAVRIAFNSTRTSSKTIST